MEFTQYLDDADSEFTPFGILYVVLQDDELAIRCLEALEGYARDLGVGNNQAPAIVFFDEEAVFGAVDLWDTSHDEEVM